VVDVNLLPALGNVAIGAGVAGRQVIGRFAGNRGCVGPQAIMAVDAVAPQALEHGIIVARLARGLGMGPGQREAGRLVVEVLVDCDGAAASSGGWGNPGVLALRPTGR